MEHMVVAPVLLPFFTGVLLILLAERGLAVQRLVSVAGVALLVLLCAWLLTVADAGAAQAYRLGNWPAPFGIVLVLDRLSALMVLLTSVVALFSLLHAVQGQDATGPLFHTLFQLQLVGLNGAFLTGDLFNLFVFFEILLIASYCLLVHGSTAPRLRAGLHYVVLNLVGSGLFLIAVGTLYGVTGTLNMADMAQKVALLGPADAALCARRAAAADRVRAEGRARAALLLAAECLFRCERAGRRAVRDHDQGRRVRDRARLHAHFRTGRRRGRRRRRPVAAAARAGHGHARHDRRRREPRAATDAGLPADRLGRRDADRHCAVHGRRDLGGLYYLVHSTIVMAGMFLIADLVAKQRGGKDDLLVTGPALPQAAALGGMFFLGAVAVIGLPPLSGFLGKALILDAALPAPAMPWVWAVVLASGLLGLLALSRAGITMFWAVDAEQAMHPESIRPARAFMPAAGLIAVVVLISVLAGPLTEFTADTADQLLDPGGYIRAVLGGGAE
jgi:multicomponent K+:H+ antiporter subunit D